MPYEGPDDAKPLQPSQDPDPFPSDYPYLKSYSFDGKVVLGIAVIIAVAAAGTILAMSVSQSPQISISPQKSGLSGADMSANAQQPANNASRKLILVADEFGWNGTENGPTIRVTKGETIQLTVINAGKMAHNFGIAKVSPTTQKLLDETKNLPLPDRLKHISYADMSSHPCPGCDAIFHDAHIMRFIHPDDQQVVTFTADQEGQFKYFCMVRGHLWLGMIGDLIVESGKNIVGSEPEIVKGGGVQ